MTWLQSSLLFPNLTHYRGAWFAGDRFDQKIADDWFARKDSSISQIERVCSHIHVLEDGCFEPVFGEAVNLKDARAIADIIAFSWKTWALERHGVELEIFVEEEGQPDVIDYVVSFQSKQAR